MSKVCACPGSGTAIFRLEMINDITSDTVHHVQALCSSSEPTVYRTHTLPVNVHAVQTYLYSYTHTKGCNYMHYVSHSMGYSSTAKVYPIQSNY